MVLDKTLESPLDCKEIKPINPKGNQSRIFTGRTDAEAETSILWPADAKNWLTGKDPDAEEDWRQEEKGMTEDEMVVWHHGLNGHEFEQAPGVGDGQGNELGPPGIVLYPPLAAKMLSVKLETWWIFLGKLPHLPQNVLKKLVWEGPHWNKPIAP